LLAARAIERKYELCPQPLAVRLIGDEALELWDKLDVIADLQLRVDRVL
jgi:hypothetical protein